jgi:6-phosphofructokinase 1
MVRIQSLYKVFIERTNYPAFNIPIVCLPAAINNNLPGTELSIGADTALNNIIDAVDKIKQSAVASQRVFVVEVMGHYCGYLALMSGLATGAERVYLHEEGIKLINLQTDLENLVQGFTSGKRLGLLIRNEYANPIYTTSFMCSLFEEEGGNLFDVRQAILGHLQQGGNPSPFDRIQATRLASRCIDYLISQIEKGSQAASFIGLIGGTIQFNNIEDFLRMVDFDHERPKEQWWLNLRSIAEILAQSSPVQS